jgi:hypothetical protein
MQALQSVKNLSRMLEDAYATGVAVLGQYAIQQDRLKSAQRKAYGADLFSSYLYLCCANFDLFVM